MRYKKEDKIRKRQKYEITYNIDWSNTVGKIQWQYYKT